jgi:asparagine synthase (glutamine-hydrolysing)
MFAFAIWDDERRTLFAARDRFGVKPFYYARTPAGALAFASEIKSLWAAGIPRNPNAATWAGYLRYGLHEHAAETFWTGILALPPGHLLRWRSGQTTVECWYDVAERVGQAEDRRSDAVVLEEYGALLAESVRLRFRADVPVGICVSGGLDSSTLLGAIRAVQGPTSGVDAFTFVTGDPAYDELPWVQEALARTAHPLTICRLESHQVPALAETVQRYQDEPFGGLPTLAYARVFEEARARGVLVLLDGQGMDEQWAGYDYYLRSGVDERPRIVQGTREPATRADCLLPEFAALATGLTPVEPFGDALRNTQYRDLRYTKIPRALRFNDRVSMRSSVELREPFLDHRLVELALRQPLNRKIRNGTQKWLLRRLAAQLMPQGLVTAPKRPLQTPQREWLRGPLRDWATAQLEAGLAAVGGAWLDRHQVRRAWARYLAGQGDQSFFVWQWLSAGILLGSVRAPRSTSARVGGLRV